MIDDKLNNKETLLEDRLIQSTNLLKQILLNNPSRYMTRDGCFNPPDDLTSSLSDYENFLFFEAAVIDEYQPVYISERKFIDEF